MYSKRGRNERKSWEKAMKERMMGSTLNKRLEEKWKNNLSIKERYSLEWEALEREKDKGKGLEKAVRRKRADRDR